MSSLEARKAAAELEAEVLELERRNLLARLEAEQRRPVPDYTPSERQRDALRWLIANLAALAITEPEPSTLLSDFDSGSRSAAQIRKKQRTGKRLPARVANSPLTPKNEPNGSLMIGRKRAV